MFVQGIVIEFGSGVVAGFSAAVKLMSDGGIRGVGKMAQFVTATIPDLILRIIFARILSNRFGSTGVWLAWPFGWIVATVLTIIFYRNIVKENKKQVEDIISL